MAKPDAKGKPPPKKKAPARPPAKPKRTAARTSEHKGEAPPKRSRWRRWRRPIVRLTLVTMVVVAAVPPLRERAAVGASRAILFATSPLTPYVGALDELPQTSRILAKDGSTLAELSGSEPRLPVPLASLPLHVRQAVLAAEDERFYEHSGVDPEAVFRALWSTVRGKTQGGSTLTQQLAKINYTTGERTVLRKLKEVLYASKLEKTHTKDELLERYVNQVYFGDGAYGIDAAAESFFGIPAAQLTPAQAALLAGKLRAPEILDPRKRPERTLARRDQVLRTMARQGWLDQAGLKAALAEPLRLAPHRPPAILRAPHFVEYVKREARRLEELGATPEIRTNRVFSAGMTITTTLDPALFDATAAAVGKELGGEGDPLVAAASVAPGDGAIRSLFGGIDFGTTQFDPSSLGGRQPGSAFKPFVYLAALRQRIDPRSLFDGTSGRQISCYGDRPVRNFSGEDETGVIDVDTALVRSVNVVFVDLGCRVGVDAVLDAAVDAGIPRDATESQGAVFLGGLDRGVSALTMAAAYATFASGGMYAEPYAISEIRDAQGVVVYRHKPFVHRAFDAREVGILNGTLERAVADGTGRAASGIGRVVAGKTGTTQGFGDAWFAGYVPQIATAVWVGYEPRRSMVEVHGRPVTGGSFPARIFAELMRTGLRGVPARALPVASPDDLELRMLEPPSTTTTTATTTTPASTEPPPG